MHLLVLLLDRKKTVVVVSPQLCLFPLSVLSYVLWLPPTVERHAHHANWQLQIVSVSVVVCLCVVL